VQPHGYVIVAVLATLGLQAMSALGQQLTSNILTTNSPFVGYLENPPWIKETTYVESHFHRVLENGEVKAQFWINMTNRGGIQPSGFFIEELTTPKYSPVFKAVRGMSDHYYWSAQTNSKVGSSLSLSSRRAGEGESETNLDQIVGEEFREKLQRLRHFGLPALLTNSFRLIDRGQFKAQTVDGYEVQGKFLGVSNNRPLALRYNFEGATNDIVDIKYAYAPGEELPNYFEYVELRNGKPYHDPHSDWLHPVTNWILTLDYGIEEDISNGYTPAMFFSNLTNFTIVISSNGMRYEAKQSGKLAPVDTSIPRLPDRERRAPLIGALVIFLFVGGLTVWKLRSIGRK
jgi:hypothetical protein